MVNKKIDQVPVKLEQEVTDQLKKKEECFDSQEWTLDQFCRLALLLELSSDANVEQITTLLSTADTKEQVVIYRSLIFLENANQFTFKMIDGIRTNMIDVFDSIALRNSFASKYFGEDAWNQMILKAIFMERPIYKIHGVERRNNSKLTHILHDFVHERWAAGRAVAPELWRMMNGFLTEEIVEDLKKVISEDTPIARKAALKLILESDNQVWLDWVQSQDITYQTATWDEIGNDFWSSTQTI